MRVAKLGDAELHAGVEEGTGKLHLLQKTGCVFFYFLKYFKKLML